MHVLVYVHSQTCMLWAYILCMSLLYLFNPLKALLWAPETPTEVKVKLGAKETAGPAGWEAGWEAG